MNRIILFCFVLLSFYLSGCSYYDSNKRATCNRLKSNIIFSGATSNTRIADIQKAEKPLQQRQFDADNCQ